MATYEKLKNPPATEALISITVEPAKDIRIDKLEEIHNEIISIIILPQFYSFILHFIYLKILSIISNLL